MVFSIVLLFGTNDIFFRDEFETQERTGRIAVSEMRHILSNLPEKLSYEEVDEMLRTADKVIENSILSCVKIIYFLGRLKWRHGLRGEGVEDCVTCLSIKKHDDGGQVNFYSKLHDVIYGRPLNILES